MARPALDLSREVIETISGLLEKLGSPTAVHTDDALEDLGLDSLAGVEFACQIEERIQISIPKDVNPFVNDRERRLRSVGEVIDVLRTLLH